MPVLILLALGLVFFRLFLSAWFVMILVGMLHSMHPQVPALGFTTCLLLTTIVMTMTYQVSSSGKGSS